MDGRIVSVRAIVDLFRKELNGVYERKETDSIIELLFSEWKGWSRLQTYFNNDQLLSEEEVDSFTKALSRLKDHVPVQYITGKVFFYGSQFSVSPDVLIPRPETEELVSLIIKENENFRNRRISIFDIGTGSGCIAICLKRNFPGSTVHAIDSSFGALKVAMKNARKHQCTIGFHHADIFNKSDWNNFSSFDLIVSNPPYVLESEKHQMEKNVTEHEPPGALFVSDDDALKYYSIIAEFALIHLSMPGRLYLEINERYGYEIRSLLLSNGFVEATILKDINGRDRFIRAALNTLADPVLFRY